MAFVTDILLVLAVLCILAAGWRIILMDRVAKDEARTHEAIIAALQIDLQGCKRDLAERKRDLEQQRRLLASANAWMMLTQSRLRAVGKDGDPPPVIQQP